MTDSGVAAAAFYADDKEIRVDLSVFPPEVRPAVRARLEATFADAEVNVADGADETEGAGR